MSKTLENLLNENNQNSQTQNNSSQEQEPSLTAILANVLTPLIPVMITKLTGQKLPVNNPIPNDQNSLQQLTPVLQNMISTQNLLLQEIVLLKKNDQFFASNFQNLRLTREREKQEIEFNPNQNQENYE